MKKNTDKVGPEAAYIVETFGHGPYLEYRIPGIVITERGTILCCCEGRMETHNDWAPIDIVILRSTDQGKTFTRYAAAGANKNPAGGREQEEETDTWNNPVLTADGSLVHLIFHRNYERAFYCCSKDDGKTFSEPADITVSYREFPYDWNVCASGPGHGIVTDAGRLVVPVWLAKGQALDRAKRRKTHKPSVCGLVFSDDRGRTWHGGTMVKGPVNANETTVAQLYDGRLLLNIRNEEPDGYRAIGIAADAKGELEELWIEKSLPDPGCFGSMVSLQGEHDRKGLVFVNCANREPGQKTQRRIDLTVYRTDNGRTWNPWILADTRGGYADIACDGEFLYLFYERCIWTDGYKRVQHLILKKYRIWK